MRFPLLPLKRRSFHRTIFYDRAFVAALKHLCRANLLAIREILKVRTDAVFIQSESAEYFHLGCGDPAMVQKAEWENQRRFLSFDLLYSVPPSTELGLYLLDNGLTREEFRWFMSHGLDERIVMGNDYYPTNEHVVVPGGRIKIGNEMMPAIMQALEVDLPGRAVESMMKAWQALKARWLAR